jgi:hypothetical protein
VAAIIKRISVSRAGSRASVIAAPTIKDVETRVAERNIKKWIFKSGQRNARPLFDFNSTVEFSDLS